MTTDRPWFRYVRKDGRFKAVPASWEGWLVTFGFVAFVVGLMLAPMYLFDDRDAQAFGAIGAVLVGLTVGLTVLLKLIIAKGRQVN